MEIDAQVGDEDIALIIQLLLEDAEEALSAATGKGKQPSGTETDKQIAIKLYLEDLRKLAADKGKARRFQQSVTSDSNTLLQSQREEQTVQDVRDTSPNLGNGEGRASAHTTATEQQALEATTDDIDEILIDRVKKQSYLDATRRERGPDGGGQPESSAQAASRPPKAILPKRECAACVEHFVELAQCCEQPVPFDENRAFLDAEIAQQFPKKVLEYSTPHRNRTYCCNRDCAAFIPNEVGEHTTASCDECGSRTCIACKNAAHDGVCPVDEELQRVLRLANHEGWQRCSSCGAMVELDTGCLHMTCRCGYQFCYACGLK
ncbi:hypothetical protein Daus18300_004635 [Diaporthe australafricana]|uniref:IBR domain-containing protein n=1 Tax=Diaporthe australafricana TaxID=127596 RepID=A0ABR3X7J4_9PEZI